VSCLYFRFASPLLSLVADDSLPLLLQYYLFDLVDDPYETTNLYNSDSTYEAIQDELYEAIAQYNNYYDTAETSSENEDCFPTWNNADNFIVPWVKEDDIKGMRKDKVVSSWPNYCGTYTETDLYSQGLLASQSALSATPEQIKSGALDKFKPLTEEERAAKKATSTRRTVRK
jgi:hypothetical protein